MPQQTSDPGSKVIDDLTSGPRRIYNGVKNFFGGGDDDEEEKKKQQQKQGGGADPGMVQEANQSFMARALKERQQKQQQAQAPQPSVARTALQAARNRYGRTAQKPAPQK